MSEDRRSIPGELEGHRCDLPDFRGDFGVMDYGDPLAERTVQVREQYRLDEVVSGYGTEFEAQRALKRWVRSHREHGWSLESDMATEALDIPLPADAGAECFTGATVTASLEPGEVAVWVLGQ